MEDLVNISFGAAGAVGLLGYLVVFFGLILLMLVVILLGKIMSRQSTRRAQPADAPRPAVPPEAKEPTQVSRGEVALFGTDPRDAAVVMAIVADGLGKPLEEIRFISVREVEKQ